MHFVLDTNIKKNQANLKITHIIFLWGVMVLELDSHPDHNKGPDLEVMK